MEAEIRREKRAVCHCLAGILRYRIVVSSCENAILSTVTAGASEDLPVLIVVTYEAPAGKVKIMLDRHPFQGLVIKGLQAI